MTASRTPQLSLVLATLGNRPRELRRFLTSLKQQDLRDVELIVVDQSASLASAEVTRDVTDLTVHVIRSTRGLSTARNAGLRVAQGAIVSFPDDDCWYDPGLLAQVLDLLGSREHLAGLALPTRDSDNRDAANSFSRHPGLITPHSVWRQAVEAGLFLRRCVLNTVGGFVTNLGLGARSAFQAGEGTELLLRALGSGFQIAYCPELCVRHELQLAPPLKRVRAYSRGIGRVVREADMPLKARLATLARPAAGTVAALATGDVATAQIRAERFIGQLEGFFAPQGLDAPPDVQHNHEVDHG